MKRRWWIVAIGTVLVGYYAGGYRYVDDKLSQYINEGLDGMVVNPYNVSVAEDADPEELSKLNNLTRGIRDNEIKDDLRSKVTLIQDQVELQHKLLQSSESLHGSTKYTDMDSENVDRNIDMAYEVNNAEIRHKILRLNQEVKDKTSSVNRAEEAMSKLNKEPNLANYYSAQSYVDAVQYEDVKQTMQADLNKNYQSIMEETQANVAKSEREVRDIIQEIRERRYSFESGQSHYQQLAQPVYNAYTSFPGERYVLFISPKRIELYDNFELINQGIIVRKSTNSPFPIKDKINQDSERNQLTVAGLDISSIQNDISANLTIDPNFYEILLDYVDKEVVVVEGE